MNKLRKPAPAGLAPASTCPDLMAVGSASKHSRTMDYALGFGAKDLQVPSAFATISLRPTTQQYWAARALVAETLLAAETEHHQSIKRITHDSDMMRTREICHIRKASQTTQAIMEKLVIGLTVTVIAFGAVGFFLVYLSRPAQSPPPSRWGLATHFTIPILSPFASVVENETSAIGTRTVVACFTVVVFFVYLRFRGIFRTP